MAALVTAGATAMLMDSPSLEGFTFCLHDVARAARVNNIKLIFFMSVPVAPAFGASFNGVVHRAAAADE